MIGVLLGACAHNVQTTSGAQYLQRYHDQVAGTAPAAMSPEILAAASVEPILRFPARIGVARVEDGRLSPMPQAEAETWLATARTLGPGFGEFVPVSPLVTALASPASRRSDDCRFAGCIDQTVREIRLGAARQHLDVVLIYEVAGRDRSSSNPLAVTKLVLIGFFLPSESVRADGVAQAMLVDVRNGYTYGFASATADNAASALSSTSNSRETYRDVAAEAKAAAVTKLAAEVEKMALRLRAELAEVRTAR